MVELFFVVPTHVYIDQCIDVLNVFKANYKDNYVTFFWGLAGIAIVKFKHVCHMDLV